MEEVKGLERGLDVLMALGEMGSGTVRQIAKRAGVSQQAAYRSLESLRRKGFAHRNTYREAYRATTRTLTVGGEISPDVVVMSAARPVMTELTRTLKWPMLLTGLTNTEMTALEATDFLLRRNMRGFVHGAKLPFFERPSWALYQAACPPDKARELFAETVAKFGPQLFVRDREFHASLLARIRSQGYVIYDAFRGPEGSIGVPIASTGERFFALELRFVAAEVPRATIKNTFAPALKAAAKAIKGDIEPLLAAIAALRTAVV